MIDDFADFWMAVGGEPAAPQIHPPIHVLLSHHPMHPFQLKVVHRDYEYNPPGRNALTAVTATRPCH